MPYTGLPNRDVMQLVTGGGRLGKFKKNKELEKIQWKHPFRCTTKLSNSDLSNHGWMLESITWRSSNILDTPWTTYSMHSRSRNHECTFAELLPPTVNGTWCNNHETVWKWWFLPTSSKLFGLSHSTSWFASYRWTSPFRSDMCDITGLANNVHPHAHKFTQVTGQLLGDILYETHANEIDDWSTGQHGGEKYWFLI